MAFRWRSAACWLAVASSVSCSVDERRPTVSTAAVTPQCELGGDLPRCDDAFVQRCSAAGRWQREPAPCELGCKDGACVPSGTGPERPGQAADCGNDGDLCDDRSFCTVADTCVAGQCQGTPRDCDDGVACTLGDACDEDSDRCLPGATQCAEAELCDATSGECSLGCSGCVLAGVCHAPGAANPANPCEVCDPAASAEAFTAAASTVACDDGIACTEGDRCEGGGCSGTPLPCAAEGRCSESTGTCVGSYTVALGAASVVIAQGSSASLTLSLVRGEDHALPVVVTVTGLPPGVDAEALNLSGNEDFATLTLNVAPRAAEGVRTPLIVRTSDGFSVVSQPLELFVRGEPGSLDLSFGDRGTARVAPAGAPGFQGTRVLVDADDRILVAATSRFILDPLGVPARASLTRLSPEGALDAAFADGGTYLETPGSPGLGEGPTTFFGGVALAPGGYVLAGPLGEGAVQEASFVTRLGAAGDRAPGFAAPTLGGGLRLSAVAVQNGTLFAVGQNLGNAALYRSDLDGGSALRVTDFNILASLQAVFWSPADNDFVLAGNCDPDACFARLNDAVTPPQIAVSRITDLAPSTTSILDATADAQGRYFGIANRWNLVRFLPDAVRPPGVFNFSVVVDPLASGGSSPQGLERSGDRLYVAAALPDPGSETATPALVRYSTTWARDVTFAAGGVAQLDGAVEVGSTVDVAVQSDGRVIVATVDQGELVVYRVWD